MPSSGSSALSVYAVTSRTPFGAFRPGGDPTSSASSSRARERGGQSQSQRLLVLPGLHEFGHGDGSHAPVRLTTTSGWPRWPFITDSSARAMRSVAPPGGKPTRAVTGFTKPLTGARQCQRADDPVRAPGLARDPDRDCPRGRGGARRGGCAAPVAHGRARVARAPGRLGGWGQPRTRTPRRGRSRLPVWVPGASVGASSRQPVQAGMNCPWCEVGNPAGARFFQEWGDGGVPEATALSRVRQPPPCRGPSGGASGSAERAHRAG